MEVSMSKVHFLAGATAVFLLAGPLLAQGPAPQVKPAAIVNGETITTAEIKKVLDQRPTPTPLTASQQRELEHTVLNMLIEDLLMRQFLRKNAPPADPNQVNKEIEELKAHLAKNKKDLAGFLKESHQTEAELRADIASRNQWQAYAKVKISDAEVKRYYDENKTFFDKIIVRASHILLKTTPQTKAEVAAKLNALRGDIVANKTDFATAAKQFSDCPSKAQGGDVGFFPCKFVMAEPFAKAAFALKVGEVSGVVETEHGLHLIKVVDRNQGEPSTFERVRDDVREICSQDLMTRVLTDERRNAKIQILLP
jgi:parvulin-like peptidyl-prolyl isomerase